MGQLADRGLSQIEPGHGGADHGRHGKDHRRQNGRRRAQAKEHDDGHEIGENRNGLELVEGEQRRGLDVGTPEQGNAGPKPRRSAKRHRHGQQRHGLHGAVPQAKHQQVSRGNNGEQRQSQPADAPGQKGPGAKQAEPRQWRNDHGLLGAKTARHAVRQHHLQHLGGPLDDRRERSGQVLEAQPVDDIGFGNPLQPNREVLGQGQNKFARPRNEVGRQQGREQNYGCNSHGNRNRPNLPGTRPGRR